MYIISLLAKREIRRLTPPSWLEANFETSTQVWVTQQSWSKGQQANKCVFSIKKLDFAKFEGV